MYRQNLDQYSLETHELFEKLVNKLVRQYENIESMAEEERVDEEEKEDATENLRVSWNEV